jgi:hypothetical protein
MKRSLSWSIAFLFALFTSEAFASPAPVSQPAWRPNKSNPYKGLFQPAPLVKPDQRAQLAQPSTAKPTEVCGMTMIPADPSLDSKFTKTPPDRSTKYTMRLLDPTVCKPVAR